MGVRGGLTGRLAACFFGLALACDLSQLQQLARQAAWGLGVLLHHFGQIGRGARLAVFGHELGYGRHDLFLCHFVWVWSVSP